MDNQDEPLFSKINANVKKLALSYVNESKLNSINHTATLRGLVERAIPYYIENNPIRDEVQPLEKA
jgi:hypothetical protein